ncbi:serpin family protein [Candidatus Parcubacteria bacterium]|nr:MAG: serpin family protein [Candidatus Parcubacteria bacterium]
MTKYLVIPIVVLIFISYSINGVSAQWLPSPLNQIKMGVDPNNVQCYDGLQLVLRSNVMPACVKSATADILNQRGLILFMELVPASIEPPPTEKPEPSGKEASDIIEASNEFMLDFYSLNSAGQDNIFFSPWSILSAFSVVYEGARGQTAEEVASATYLPRDDLDRRDSFKTTQQSLNPNSTEYELTNANALWIKTGFGVKQEFVDIARQYYDSEVAEVEFPAGEPKIDSWVENKTNGKIKDLVKDKTNDMTRLVITNAVYFMGTWKDQFNANLTSQDDFTLDSGDTVKIPMMYQKSRFDYAENDNLQILSMPYKGDRLSMLVLLPKNNLGALEGSLTLDELSSWQEGMRNQQVYVYIPKFKLETEYDLSPQMKELGVELAFDPDYADLSGIADVTPNNLYIGFATHKAFVDVNEEGTEAAAATAIGIEETSAPIDPTVFRADHPFVFLIQDNETGLVLFMGRVSDPS